MDFRLLPLSVGLWFSCAGTLIFVTRAQQNQLILWFLILPGLIAILIRKNPIKVWNQVSINFLILGLLIGLFLAFIRLQPLYAKPLSIASEQNAVVKVQAILIEDLKRSQVVNSLDLGTRDFGVFKVRASKIYLHGATYRVRIPIQVYISGDELSSIQKLPPGSHLLITGKLSAAEKIRGIAAKLSTTSSIEVVSSPPNYQYMASKFRTDLHQILSTYSIDVAGLIPGLALGDNSNLSKQLALDMKKSGLTHLTAVSGSNVTLLIALVLAFGKTLKIPNRYSYLLSVLALIAFVILVRPQPSVLRAGVMGLIMIFALFSKSPRSSIPALTLSVILLILIDPWLTISYGFALSVFATAGLLLFANSLLISFDHHLPRRIPKWLVLGLVVTVSAQIAVFPILIALDSPISLSSLPANLIAVPLAGPTMILGLLAAISAQVWIPLAQFFALLSTIPAGVIVYCAKIFAKQEWLVIPWPKGSFGILLSCVVIYLASRTKLSWPKFSAIQKETLLICWICFAFIIWSRPGLAFFNWAPNNWKIASCDVGQGDSTVIRISHTEAIVVDVGGDPERIDKCLHDLKIKRIPLLLLTHFHADHVVGLPGAIAGREIGQVRISPLANPPLTTKFVNEVFAENNLSAQVMAYPEYLKIADVELFCIWPKRILGSQSDTPNNASVSLLVVVDGITLLLPGDIEPIAQNGILDLIGNIETQIIKVPHHGSKYQSIDFARATNSNLALISAGSDNLYGHPAKSTIELYESIGAQVFRTDQNGSIAIWKTNGKLKVKTQK